MSTTSIPAALRRLVVERAEEKCEYCCAPQLFSSYSYEIDHIIAEKHGGSTSSENLALACFPCNRHKGSDIASFDPLTGELTRLFDPRSQEWSAHFRLENARIVGATPTGRTTVLLLRFNDGAEVLLRQMMIEQGVFP